MEQDRPAGTEEATRDESTGSERVGVVRGEMADYEVRQLLWKARCRFPFLRPSQAREGYNRLLLSAPVNFCAWLVVLYCVLDVGHDGVRSCEVV